MRSRWLTCIALVLFVVVISGTIHAGDNDRRDRISGFDIGSVWQISRSADPGSPQPVYLAVNKPTRRSVGSALSPEAGIGKGASIDLSFDDAQQTQGQGRHISHWWNGEYGGSAKVSLHFGYRSMTDTLVGFPLPMSGYNVYDAVGGTWPRTQDIGCDLQTTDTLGWGSVASLDIMSNGRAVMTSMSHFFNGFLTDSAYADNMVFYQADEFGCAYAPGVNTTFIDSATYRAHFMDQSIGNYSRHPQIVTQWDGSNSVIHLLLFETLYTPLAGADYTVDRDYITCLYYRKVGESADAGAWSAGQIIDSLTFPWASMAAAPFPDARVAISYTNPSYWGALLNNGDDRDVWYRESLDRGLTWQPAVYFTEYMNGIAGNPNHFTAWLESQCLYSTDGDLHIVWTAKETSYDPYFDGFNWVDFNTNVYHWSRSHDDVTKVADGTYDDGWGCLLGTIHTLHCGYGGSNAMYVANVNIAECDDKLYCVWNQIHERAAYMPWRDSPTQPAPGVLDDCSYTGNRMAMANWEILMSVARLSTSSLWDKARNISDTYTADCGLPGDPLADGPCGSEYKPALEPYGLDESGLSLTWPAEALVDMNPEAYGPYTGTSFLNMQYVDDQFPGPAFWGRTNPPASLNSLKWIRLACVDPIEASEIRVSPEFFWWPQWVEMGQVNNLTVTVQNEGNLMLNITEIECVESTGSGWLSTSESPTPSSPFQVTSGVVNTATFDIIVDASALSSTTWLDGEVLIHSDAINAALVSIDIHLLAAADVEPVVWDTVMSHVNMFDVYFYPEGECVALAVGNHGEFGYGAGGSGLVNLDYAESETECGHRLADAIYLKSGSAFAITADAADGSNAKLTSSYNHPNQYFEHGWDPIGTKGSITGGQGTSYYNGNDYDSVYTGAFVNRDTTIAMERTFYTPRSPDPANDIINFVICYTKFYSADGAGHNHVTLGNVCDWNVPSEDINVNTSGVSGSGFVYMQGTDTTGVLSCQPNTNRFATESFGGEYTSEEWLADPCVNNQNYQGVSALSQSLLQDTTHYRDGTPLVPPQPNPEVWWDETAIGGLNADPTVMDQAVWFTYVHDYNLGATDTLHFWTVLTTVRDGNIADLEAQVSYAKQWYLEAIGCYIGGCCVGRVGDANGLGGDEPTIGDISVMIDALFITGTCDGIIACLSEADINQSGGCDPTCDDITIGDISCLICPLFIMPIGCELPLCLPCNTVAAPDGKAVEPQSILGK